MINDLKALFSFGDQARLKRALAIVETLRSQPVLQAMPAAVAWLEHELPRAGKHRHALELLRTLDGEFRAIADNALAGMIEAHTNHTRLVLLLKGIVPFCATVLTGYADALQHELAELAKKPSTAPQVQASVANWLYWLGRDHVVRFVRDPNDERLPWHEIRPTVQFALEQGGGLAAKLSRPDAESGRLQKQLAYLVLLSRTCTRDLQGRQILIADRLADALAGFIRVSDEHSAQTPFGQDAEDDSPPTMLSQVATRGGHASRGLFYGLERSLQELVVLEQLIISQHKVPQKFNSDGRLDVAETLAVIRHLKNRWSGREVKRLAERKDVSGTLTIAHDFGVVRRLIVAAMQGKTTVHTVETTVERAAVENVSATGVGLKLVNHTGWLRLGLMMGFRTDRDANWRVGIVRRALARGHGEMFAGVQMLSRDPESIRLTREAKISAWERVSDAPTWDNLLAVYLRPEALNNDQHLMVLAKQELEVGKIYGAPGTREGDLAFRVLTLEEIAADCVIYRCERMSSVAAEDAPTAHGALL